MWMPVYLLQVMLLEEAPFEVLYAANEQPASNKLAKETNPKNTIFIPVPDSGRTYHISLPLFWVTQNTHITAIKQYLCNHFNY